MNVRPGVEKDLPAVSAIEKVCFPPEVAFSEQALEHLLRHALTLVAVDKEVVGFVAGVVFGKTGKAITLDVHPRCRRRGIGGMLMEALEDEFAALGAKVSLLEVSSVNQAALALYSALGYRYVVILEGYYGPGRDAVSMQKCLATDPYQNNII
ncbi:MAG: GNAT family N-acetyltransferase [Euryarchaeota archaeon]|nr:GNAT family N-acetyltransferase [Euryarchaeota archaeon]